MVNKVEKMLEKCPSKFTFIDDMDGYTFYGRCVGDKKLVQIVEIEKMEGNALIQIKNYPLNDLINEQNEKTVLASTGIDKEDYDRMSTLGKALEHVQYGFGKNIALGEKMKYPTASQTHYLAKEFKNEKLAEKFMNTELTKPEYM